jgi:hypothetical protein
MLNRLLGMYLIVSLLTIGLVVFSLVDIITHQDSQVKYLPKIVWVLLVVFLPLIGSVLWFVLGRDHGDATAQPRYSAPAERSSTPSRPNVPFGSAPVARPRTTEEQLADLDREIEFYQQQELEAKQAELEARKRRNEVE